MEIINYNVEKTYKDIIANFNELTGNNKAIINMGDSFNANGVRIELSPNGHYTFSNCILNNNNIDDFGQAYHILSQKTFSFDINIDFEELVVCIIEHFIQLSNSHVYKLACGLADETNGWMCIVIKNSDNLEDQKQYHCLSILINGNMTLIDNVKRKTFEQMSLANDKNNQKVYKLKQTMLLHSLF